MVDFSNQITRIKKKLDKAKNTDTRLKVFGASSHKYHIDSPVEKHEVKAFENRFSISLPDCYRAFVLNIGNGGVSYRNSGAGPFYGIYPLGKQVNELIYSETVHFLKQRCILHPNLTKEEWNDWNTFMDDDTISNDDYYLKVAKLYSGILPIGFQGCSALHTIVLNGTYRGRVVNVDMDGTNPRFTFENNFLDWYERWLDEVISGQLIKAKTSWFGYKKKLS